MLEAEERVVLHIVAYLYYAALIEKVSHRCLLLPGHPTSKFVVSLLLLYLALPRLTESKILLFRLFQNSTFPRSVFGNLFFGGYSDAIL